METAIKDNNNIYIGNMEDENGFSTPMLIFAAIMTILIMIVGIIGNFLTVAALINCPKVRNVAAAFIMSLCIADLLFCALVLPFSAYRFIQGTWTPREFFCKMIPFIQYGNIGVSLLCIAMITINRYVMIAHHSSYGKIYKNHWIAAMIIFCWVFSYGMQLPTLVGAWGTFDYDPKLGTCSIMTDDYGRSSKTALFITAFIIPCLIIIACYTKIFWVVHKSEERMKRHAKKQNSIPNNLRVINSSNVELGNCQSRTSSAESSSFSMDVKPEAIQKPTPSRIKDQREVRAKRNEWRITKMVLAIFLSFVICYLPITIVKVADQDVMHPNFHILSYIMLYMSACLNPIIYVIMNKQYRKAYKTVVKCDMERLFKCRNRGNINNKGGPTGSSVAEMERYRIESQSQPYFGLANVSQRSPKYQFQRCQPSNDGTTIHNAAQSQCELLYQRTDDNGDIHVNKIAGFSYQRRRDQFQNDDNQRSNDTRTTTIIESQQEQQQQQRQQQYLPNSTFTSSSRETKMQRQPQSSQRTKPYSLSGRGYNIRGGRGRNGTYGRIKSAKQYNEHEQLNCRQTTSNNITTRSDNEIITENEIRAGSRIVGNANNADNTATTTSNLAEECPPSIDTSLRECERLTSFLRSEYQRHTR